MLVLVTLPRIEKLIGYVLYIGLLIAIISFNSWAAMIEKNDYFPADDGDLNSLSKTLLDPVVDRDLINIIERTVILEDEGGSGTALLAGPGCKKVLTAKHNIYDRETGKAYSSDFSVSYKNKKYGVDLNNKENTKITKNWLIADEGGSFALNSRPPVASCPKIPRVKRSEARGLFKGNKLNNCRLVSFPGQVKLVNGEEFLTNFSGVPIPGTKRLNYYPKGKRGITKCKILDVGSDGMTYYDCDSLPGSSGGPIVCKVGTTWKYVSTNNGGACQKDGVVRKDLCHVVNNGPKITLNRTTKTHMYGNGGTFEE
jgi:hypothetical protein